MINLKKITIAAASAAVVAAAVVPSQAMARGGHGDHHGGGGAWPFALVGGLAAGALIASAANDRGDNRYYGQPVSYAPPPPAYYPAQQPCRQVNRLDDVEGYTVKMAATMCYDSYGRAYIVRGSEHPVDDGYDY